MTRPGPRPTPTALKRAHNMPSLKNRNKNEPDVPAIQYAPPPPDWIHPHARLEWERCAILMCDVGMLTELDLAVLAAYSESFATVLVATEKLRVLAKDDASTDGLVVRSQGGSAYMNPLQAIKQRAMRDMVKYAAELGLTPAGRASISVGDRGGAPAAQRPAGKDIAAKYNL